MEERNGKTVSVIVPVYNGERYLKRCMDSLERQTWKNMEILWIDDGSVDGSGKICDDFGKTHENVRVIHTENKGVSSARNLGLEEAAGDYVTFVDADDCPAADMVEHLVRLLEETGCDVAGCGFWEFGPSEEAADGRKTTIPYRVEVLSGPEFMEKGVLGSDTRCWSKLYRKESIGGIRFIQNLTIGEDMLFLLELARAGKTFGQSSDQGYGYFINSEGAMMHKFKDSYMDQILCWEKALQVFTEAAPELRDKAEAVLLVSAMLTAGKLAMLTGKERKEKWTYAEKCLDVVKKYGGHKGAFGKLDKSYRIKVALYRYMPRIYMRMYRYFSRFIRLNIVKEWKKS